MGIDVEVVAGSQYPLVNVTEVATGEIADSEEFRQLARAMSDWVTNTRNAAGRSSMFDRGMFSPPDNVYDEMRAARNAVEYDDVVSGAAEVTESFAFQGLKWESEDLETSDVFNQMAKDLDLDSLVRRMWREEFATGQAVVAFTWGTKQYTPKTRTPGGKKSKKKITVYGPTSATVLDSAKIVPLSGSPLDPEVLAWQATDYEINEYTAAVEGRRMEDPALTEFFIGQYEVTDIDERRMLVGLGVDVNRLLILNPDRVYRHTTTRADYMRFPDVRLKSCFGLLDLKRQLMNADRANLIGAANYILLIRKGSKEEPARPAELENLRENYSVLARLPVIISDHRLEIEIIAPKIDLVLQPEKYDVLDARILSRLMGAITMKQEAANVASYTVARAMENRRHMLKRFLERTVARAVVDHPRNESLALEEPSLVYTPRNIALGFDAALVQAIMSLRSTRDISRETILEFVGLDQATEALRREIEADRYDEVFGTLAMPGQGPDGNTDPSQQDQMDQMDMMGPNGAGQSDQNNGAKGGRPLGGGKPSNNPAKVAPKTPNGNTKPRGASS